MKCRRPASTIAIADVIQKQAGRARLVALARESERGLVAMIRRRLALPPERRTNFLRQRVSVGRSAL